MNIIYNRIMVMGYENYKEYCNRTVYEVEKETSCFYYSKNQDEKELSIAKKYLGIVNSGIMREDKSDLISFEVYSLEENEENDVFKLLMVFKMEVEKRKAFILEIEKNIDDIEKKLKGEKK